MTTLDDLARVLGGAVRRARGLQWLDTTVGGLRAAVIRRVLPRSHVVVFELAVVTPWTRELDPLAASEDPWCLDGQETTIPALPHGYLFAGCLGGVLYATSFSPPSREAVVGVLWQLAEWARQRWSPMMDAYAPDPRQRWKTALSRFGVVAGAVVLAVLLRRLR